MLPTSNVEFQSIVSGPLSVEGRHRTPRCFIATDDRPQTTDHGRLAPGTWHLIPAAYSSNLRSLSALLITDTELNVMAAAASMGLSSSPITG